MRTGMLGTWACLLAAATLAPAQQGSSFRGVALSPKPDAEAPATSAPIKTVASIEPPSAEPQEAPVVPPPAGTLLWSDPATANCSADDIWDLRKPCNPKGIAWASAEYLLWWVKDDATGPLVTTGPGNVAPQNFGVVGSPGTQVLLGDSGLDFGAFNGLRVNAGIVGPNHRLGIEGGGFLLERRSTGIGVGSDTGGTPVIARPFVDTTSGQASRLLTSAPGSFAGQLVVNANSRFWGGEANLTRALCGLVRCDSSLEIDVLAGFRYLDLSERLEIGQQSTLLANGQTNFLGQLTFAPATLSVADSLATHCQFFGPQLGAQAEFQYDKLFIFTVVKVGVGLNHDVLSLNGASVLQGGTVAPQAAQGGLLVLPSNAGRRTRDEVAVVPELGVNFGYQVHRNIRLYAGYTFLYWNQIVRPGDSVNPVIDVRQLPTSTSFNAAAGATQPAATFPKSDFWAHGVSFGMAVHF